MKLFNRKIVLNKRHDFCAVKNPKLTVVLIHGIASDATAYNHTLQYLEGTVSLREVRFVTFDLLGAGESPKSSQFNYNYDEQLKALKNSIGRLKIQTPLVLIGHSMGTLIAARYADVYRGSIKKLVLVSPPIYTKKDLASIEFKMGVRTFKKMVKKKYRARFDEEVFDKSMNEIVLDQQNYKVFRELKTPTVLIYGNMDQIIASYNIPKLLEENSEYLTAIQTEGEHSVTRDKYTKIVGILEELLNA